MSVPNFQSMMLPILQLAGDNEIYTATDAKTAIIDTFDLDENDQRELLPRGKQTRLTNRISWARAHLSKAGLLEKPKRGQFRITERGHQVLAQNLEKIDLSFLNQFPEHRAFYKSAKKAKTKTLPGSSQNENQTPEEIVENACEQLRNDLATEILESILACSPTFFEQLVVDLLVKMGYGGTRAEAGRAIGKAGDEGIDGIINEDRLGLDVVYIQAKRWRESVSRPEIQKFAGALQGKRARKGIFITTSDFTRGAKDYVSLIESKIILINGTMLADLMIDYNIGVSTFASYDIKRVDSDYFEEA